MQLIILLQYMVRRMCLFCPYRRAHFRRVFFFIMSMIIIGRIERKKERKPAKNNPSKHLGRLKTFFFYSTECFPLCIGALTHAHQLIYLYCLYTHVHTCIYTHLYIHLHTRICIYIYIYNNIPVTEQIIS